MPNMPSSKGRKPSFFKFILPDCSDKELEIPRAFLKHLEEKFSGKVLLKVSSGKIWRVEMAKKNNDVLLRNGWRSFLEDNYVKVGFCLVFRYHGKHRFSVKILDTTGCERKYIANVTSQCECDNGCDDTEENISKKGNYPRCISQRRSITEEEIEKAYNAARSYKSSNPTQIVVMRRAYVYYGFYMALPKAFVHSALPKTSTTMTIVEPVTGKEWVVKYLYNERAQAAALSAGWVTFTLANNIEEHDVCVFELIEKYKIQVNIFRVVNEIVPILRPAQRIIKS